MIRTKDIGKLTLPCLRGKIGDWFYYVSLMSYKEIARRVKLPEEIDKKYSDENLKLGDWIQRKIEAKRITPIVEYISKQKEQFFNSLVLGIYDGEPTWQDLNISTSNVYKDELDESKIDYMGKTFGVLTLQGSESIFAIDGQHRAIGIRKAIHEKKGNFEDEVSVIFVAHKTTENGKIRTRRLFSTLNRYAKPVSESEKIALSEDDNCAIITRNLVEEHPQLKNRVLVNKLRSVHPNQVNHFTSIMVLYDLVKALLVEKNIPGMGKISGKKPETYLHVRLDDQSLKNDYSFVSRTITDLTKEIPSLNDFFNKRNSIDRNDAATSIFFRPIGQNVLFDVLKVAIANRKRKETIDYFKGIDFSFKNKVWHSIFWDEETNSIVTDKARQRFVTILILEKLGYDIKRTKKDKERLISFKISIKDI